MKGQRTCGTHGGSTGAAKAKARERLLEAADPAAAKLVKALESADERTMLKAAQLILDRAGLGPGSSVELTGADGGPLEVEQQTIPLDRLTPDTKRRIIADLERFESGDGDPDLDPSAGQLAMGKVMRWGGAKVGDAHIDSTVAPPDEDDEEEL